MTSNNTPPSADEDDSDCDSEEEDDAVQLDVDDAGNPLLPPYRNMSLNKGKNTFRQYGHLTYHEYTSHRHSRGLLFTITYIYREIHGQQVGKGSLVGHAEQPRLFYSA